MSQGIPAGSRSGAVPRERRAVDLDQPIPELRLRCRLAAITIPTMFGSRETRRLAAALFGLILLLCQSIAFANACMEAIPASPATESACHDEASGDAVHDGANNICESQVSSVGQANFLLPAIATSPAFKVRFDEARAGGSCVQLTSDASARLPPVPLTLVHCRLLN